jgi:general secretion pathway protein A
MYTAFYGLREKPFALSPNPRFLFLGESHREALAHLLYGIEQGEGFIAITGEVGTGKTTLCRTLLERLGSETEVAFLFNPSRSGTELLQAISLELGLPAGGLTRRELGDQLNRHLLSRKAQGRRVLLIVDEAQNLASGTLEQIRLLSNLETSSSKLIQILLLGQPELDEKLDSHGLRQLRQRISVRWSLAPLDARDTRRYVRHRVQVAAGARRDLFQERALREIHRLTGGTPRLINILADRSLLLGYAESESQVSVKTVRRAAREIPDAKRRAARWLRPALWAAGGSLLLALVALVGWRLHADSTSAPAPPVSASPEAVSSPAASNERFGAAEVATDVGAAGGSQ